MDWANRVHLRARNARTREQIYRIWTWLFAHPQAAFGLFALACIISYAMGEYSKPRPIVVVPPPPIVGRYRFDKISGYPARCDTATGSVEIWTGAGWKILPGTNVFDRFDPSTATAR